MEFAAEIIALQAGLFFFLYQMTSMEGWTGFSFDKEWFVDEL